MKKKKGKKSNAATKDDGKGEDEATETLATTTEDQSTEGKATDNSPDKKTATEDASADDKAVEDDKDEKADDESSATPSLAQQSKLRSTSFRAGSISGAGPASPGPLSPDGDTAPEIYRKQAARIDELEKENKKLSKDSTDSEKRWKKAEDELAVLREGDGDTEHAASKTSDETEKLVRIGERTFQWANH